MSGEHRDLVEHADVAFTSLFPSRLDADDDVAEDAACERGEVALPHREGEYVCRSIFMAIVLVQFVNTFIVR